MRENRVTAPNCTDQRRRAHVSLGSSVADHQALEIARVVSKDGGVLAPIDLWVPSRFSKEYTHDRSV